ncbi:hypothetical protein K0M31_000914 [Melipona bicolor]|uniref:Secreted protein n=1 Tax=Melipona bicolor TaxID=60889 RepID=A0AA40KXA9_9HYME|nr:hypothetical protein K0M31_000914 [Melipona bicolor]
MNNLCLCVYARVCIACVRVCTCVFTERVSPNYSSSFNETDALPARTVFVLDRLTEQVFVDSSLLSRASFPREFIIDYSPTIHSLLERRSLFHIISVLLLASYPDASSKYLDLSTNAFSDERRMRPTRDE